MLATTTLLAISLQRTYHNVPVKEVKRRARADDELAKMLYRAVSYGHTLKAVLWFFVGVLAAGFFVNIALYSAIWFALAASVALVWIGFIWLPTRPVTSIGEHLAAWLARPLAWLLHYLHPWIDTINNLLRRHRPVNYHTRLYEKADLLDLLMQQQKQEDNRINQTELDIARHALVFGDKQVGQIMVPRRMVKAVSSKDSIGPVLLDELHNSGHSRFPVYKDKQSDIVGILFVRDLIKEKHGGSVHSKMRGKVGYVHEEQNLYDALQAILRTHHQMLIVVNSFEEYVGIITIEDILEQIIGRPIIDEFDQYDDLRAVAARTAKHDHEEHLEDEPEHSDTEEEITTPDESLEDESHK